MIHARMASTAEMLACFDDEALLAAALRFERGLAAAAAEHGAISLEAAAAIALACHRFDGSGLAEEAAHAGTLAIPLVARLRAAVPVEHAAAVHLGATSQDLADSALMLQAQRALALLEPELGALGQALAHLARRHARTPALGRTLLQPAAPLTLGLRLAGWLLGLDEATVRLRREGRAAIRLQLGGAVGSLAALDAGPAIRRSLAERLGLTDSLSWHGRRGSVAGLGAALAIVTGASAKMARDVSLLMQAEVAEVAEPELPGRGGSSAMPGKRNPTGCQVALSAATRVPGLAATLLSAMPQELERGLGGWQAEAPVLAELFALTHGAVCAMRDVAGGLEVHEAALAAHLPSPVDPAALDAAAHFVDEALALHEAALAAKD